MWWQVSVLGEMGPRMAGDALQGAMLLAMPQALDAQGEGLGRLVIQEELTLK